MRIKYKIICICLIICCLLSAVACGAQTAHKDSYFESVGMPAEEPAPDGSDTVQKDPVSGSIDNTHKLIVSAEFRMETLSFQETVDALRNKVTELEGYIEGSSIYNQQSRKMAYYTLRIPMTQYDTFSRYLYEAGNIIYESENTQDVTLQYNDLQAELNSLRIQQDRLNELLEKAANLSEILTLEAELANVRTRIEQVVSLLNQYDNKIAYATITLTVEDVAAYTDTEDTTPGFWKRLGTTFRRSFSTAGTVLREIFFIVIWLLPYLLFVGLVLFLCIFLSKRRNKKMRGKHDKHNNMDSPESKR